MKTTQTATVTYLLGMATMCMAIVALAAITPEEAEPTVLLIAVLAALLISATTALWILLRSTPTPTAHTRPAHPHTPQSQPATPAPQPLIITYATPDPPAHADPEPPAPPPARPPAPPVRTQTYDLSAFPAYQTANQPLPVLEPLRDLEPHAWMNAPAPWDDEPTPDIAPMDTVTPPPSYSPKPLLPRRPAEPDEYQAIAAIYEETGSLNKTIRRVYGPKDPSTHAWTKEALGL